MILYKYRTTSNLKLLLDIFLNNRLYAASYNKMNDPMEGHYRFRSGKLSPEFKSALRGEKDHFGICSLSEDSSNPLLWAHYADGHQGVAIGVTVADPNCEIKKVKYAGLSDLSRNYSHEPAEAALQVLSHKLEIWDYEKEHRAFVRHEKFVKVEVHEVIFGRRAEREEKRLLTSLISKINPDIEIKDEPVG